MNSSDYDKNEQNEQNEHSNCWIILLLNININFENVFKFE